MRRALNIFASISPFFKNALKKTWDQLVMSSNNKEKPLTALKKRSLNSREKNTHKAKSKRTYPKEWKINGNKSGGKFTIAFGKDQLIKKTHSKVSATKFKHLLKSNGNVSRKKQRKNAILFIYHHITARLSTLLILAVCRKNTCHICT